jgi:methionine-rich copper-binding protein CopC
MTRHPSNRRAAGAVAAGLFVALSAMTLALPAAVLGHSELDTPTPADKSTVTESVLQVSGTFTEAIRTDGSSLIVKDSTGVTIAQGGVDATDNKVMTASPSIPLPNASYTVQWTTVSAADGDIARGTWTFTVAVTASPSPTATPAASASASASAAPTPAATPTPIATPAPSPSPSGSGSNTGSGGDVILPIIVALIILGAGAAYLLSRRGRPAAGA